MTRFPDQFPKMIKYLLAVLTVVYCIAGCTEKINEDINDPNETATVVMVYGHSSYTDSVFFGMTGKNVVIDWGDGSRDSFPILNHKYGEIPDNASHKYAQSQRYTIKVTAEDFTTLIGTYIHKINLTRATQLKTLEIPGSFLSSIDLQSNTLLEELSLSSGGQLGKLDLSANILLKNVRVGGCGLQELNIRTCSRLEYIECDNNKLNNLDLSGNPVLGLVGFDYNNLTSLDVSRNQNLFQISGGNNKITELDISGCARMRQLNLQSNSISTIKLSPSADLHTLYIPENKLTSLDISQNPGLTTLNISNNNLRELNISTNAFLTNVDLANNQFSAADINATFEGLKPARFTSEWIRVAANPGTNGCDATIATSKKWKVIK